MFINYFFLLLFRLRLCGPERKGWSGEIPLQKNSTNTPWLVKGITYFLISFFSI